MTLSCCLLIMCVWTSAGLFCLILSCALNLALHSANLAFAQLSEVPVSVSALVGENAQFHCNGTGYIITWIVDGFLATDPTIEERGITPDTMTSSGTVQSTLTVPATLENNGTTVQCRMILLNSGLIDSNNVTLTILPGECMGILDVV